MRVPILLASLVLLLPGWARAELFLDLYGGVAETESSRVRATNQDCRVGFFFLALCGPETTATRTVGFKSSATYGIRFGYWLDAAPWLGMAGDLSHFDAKGRDAQFRVTPLSFLLMARIPLLTTDEIPRGRLQPYLGVGPGFFYQRATIDFRPDVNPKVGSESVELGLDVRAGVTWQFHRQVGLFTEYRFTHMTVSTDHDSQFHATTERVRATLDTHHIHAGISIRF